MKPAHAHRRSGVSAKPTSQSARRGVVDDNPHSAERGRMPETTEEDLAEDRVEWPDPSPLTQWWAHVVFGKSRSES